MLRLYPLGLGCRKKMTGAALNYFITGHQGYGGADRLTHKLSSWRPMTATNDDIIKRAQHGDREAFAWVVENHYELMLRVANSFCSNRSDAEDITQQACIKLARSIAQFRFESAFSSWLYRLVINCAKDWLKAQKPLALENPPESAINNAAEPMVLLQQVLALVDEMGEGFRSTVTLVIGEGLSHAEAGLILEVKESTISWRLHEIRKRLKANPQLEGGV